MQGLIDGFFGAAPPSAPETMPVDEDNDYKFLDDLLAKCPTSEQAYEKIRDFAPLDKCVQLEELLVTAFFEKYDADIIEPVQIAFQDAIKTLHVVWPFLDYAIFSVYVM